MAQLYGRDGKTNDWKPLLCRQDSDGNWQLVCDTELSVDNLTLSINNIEVGSTDNTKNNTTYLKTDADGTVHVTGSLGISGGIPEEWNGIANMASATVTFTGITRHVQIENMDGVIDLFVSFDGGTKWRTIQPGYILDLDCGITDLDIKASANGCNYEILAVI